jgi:hypothetical protein
MVLGGLVEMVLVFGFGVGFGDTITSGSDGRGREAGGGVALPDTPSETVEARAAREALKGVRETDEEDDAKTADSNGEGRGRVPGEDISTAQRCSTSPGRHCTYMAIMLLPTLPPKVR